MLRVVLAVLLFCSACATVDHDLRARQEAAMRLEAVISAEKLKELMIGEMVWTLPIDKQDEFRNIMDILLDTKGLRNIITESLAAVYSVEELNAMTTFYGSEIGQSIFTKMAAQSMAFTPKLEEILREAVEKHNSRSATL